MDIAPGDMLYHPKVGMCLIDPENKQLLLCDSKATTAMCYDSIEKITDNEVVFSIDGKNKLFIRFGMPRVNEERLEEQLWNS